MISRSAEKHELEILAALEQEVFSDPWSLQSLEEEWHSARSGPELKHPRIYVTVKDGEIIAYSASVLIHDELQLYRLAVRPDAARQGVGRAHLEALISAAASAGAGMMTLEVRESNRAARSFYKKFGVRESGRRPGYYQDTREDAVLGDLDFSL